MAALLPLLAGMTGPALIRSGILGGAGEAGKSLFRGAKKFLGFKRGGRVPGTGSKGRLIVAHPGELILPAATANMVMRAARQKPTAYKAPRRKRR